MAEPGTLRTKGLFGSRGVIRAFDRAGKDAKREFRKTFREVGEVVRVPWAQRLERYGTRTARGLRTVVRVRGVSVEQTLRKTTGLRPDFGALQVRTGIAVLSEEETAIERKLGGALDEVVDHFGRGF